MYDVEGTSVFGSFASLSLCLASLTSSTVVLLELDAIAGDGLEIHKK